MLPGLEALIAMAGEKPEVKYYEGLEGLEAMQALIYEAKTDYINVIACSERVRETLPEETRVMHSYKLKKRDIPGRQINIIDSPKAYSQPIIELKNWQVKTISRKGFSFRGEIACFSHFIALVVHTQKPLGIVIKSEDLSATFEVLFDIAWNSGQLKLVK
jgi:hypothetical protein